MMTRATFEGLTLTTSIPINGFDYSFSNVTNQTFQVNNGTKPSDSWALAGDPLVTSISCVGMVANILVILIIQKSMRMNQRRTQAQIHLQALAGSDIAVLIPVIGARAIKYVCESCFGYSFGLLLCINRSMTLFITYFRAWSLMSVSNALRIQEKTRLRIWIELLVFNAICGVAQVLVMVLFTSLLPSLIEVDKWKISLWVGCGIYTIWIVLEMILAAFILVTLRIQRQSVDHRGSMVDDFEKLVAFVALVFSFCHVINLTHNVVLLDPKQSHTIKAHWNYGSIIADVSNSSVNLPIYLLASRNFRAAFLTFGRGLKEKLFCLTN